MTHTIELTDEQFSTLERAASARGQAPEAFLAGLLEDLRDRDREPHYYETEDWFRHLGASEEQIAEAKRLSQESGDADA